MKFFNHEVRRSMGRIGKIIAALMVGLACAAICMFVKSALQISLASHWQKLAQIKELGGEQHSLTYTMQGIELVYSSPQQTRAILNQLPRAVIIDGELLALSTINSTDNGWQVALPAGKHNIEIEYEPGLMLVTLAGFISGRAIIVCGHIAIFLLATLYLATCARRFYIRWRYQ